MYASKPTDAKTPESTGRLLLIIGTALALVDGLLYVVGQLGTRYIQPKLHALRIFARSFAPHTQDPTAQVVIEALRHREIYLYGQLIAARDVLLPPMTSMSGCSGARASLALASGVWPC